MSAIKDISILKLKSKFEKDLSGENLRYVDYWEGDKCALGIMSDKEPDLLIYISNFLKDEGFYYVEAESGDIGSGETKTVFCIENVDYDTLKNQVLSCVITLNP